MNQNIRRFAAALSLAFVLGSTPVIAAPSRDGGWDDRSSIVRMISRIVQRFFGITPAAEPVPPFPVITQP
jgi:hypothetical protein